MSEWRSERVRGWVWVKEASERGNEREGTSVWGDECEWMRMNERVSKGMREWASHDLPQLSPHYQIQPPLVIITTATTITPSPNFCAHHHSFYPYHVTKPHCHITITTTSFFFTPAHITSLPQSPPFPSTPNHPVSLYLHVTISTPFSNRLFSLFIHSTLHPLP